MTLPLALSGTMAGCCAGGGDAGGVPLVFLVAPGTLWSLLSSSSCWTQMPVPFELGKIENGPFGKEKGSAYSGVLRPEFHFYKFSFLEIG